MIHFSITTIDSATEPGGLHQMLSALRGGDNSDFQQILSRTVNQGQPGPAPASQQTIDALERVQADSTSPPQCPVCFDDIAGQAVRAQCAHLFHEECILPWLREHGTCPVCRYAIEPEPLPLPPSLQAEMERLALHGVPAWTATGPRDGHLPGASSPWLAASEREVHMRALDGMLEAALLDIEDEIEDEVREHDWAQSCESSVRRGCID